MSGMLAAGDSPLSHVVQHRLVDAPFEIPGFLGGLLTPDGRITILSDQMLMMLLAGLLLSVFFPRLTQRRRGTDEIGSMVPSGFANFVETLCHYLRENVAKPNLQEHTDRFITYIWSVFFFILTMNLLGLLPIPAISVAINKNLHLGGTPTGNIFVTAVLALCTMFMMVFNGLRIGGKDYLAHFCPGPILLAPLLVPVELLGLGAKIFALAIRLFANMMAGHILLAVLLSFIGLAIGSLGMGGGLLVAVPVIVGSIAITML
ncbi:MAG: F0F1 ATP synthase subunit A, partial [Phycisphaerae bacterium]